MPGKMKLQSTVVMESDPLTVEVLIADAANPDDATDCLQIRLRSPRAKSDWHLPAIHREVLERARDVLNDEIQNARERLSRAPNPHVGTD